MIQEIKMPSAGQTTDEATIVKVNVKVGDTVKRGDELLEAETDKAILPVESFAAGTVLDVLVQEGDAIAIDIPNASIMLQVSEEELAARKAAYVQPAPNITTGWLGRYARMVTSADEGAVLR